MFGRRRLLIVDGGARTAESYPAWLMDAGHDTSVVDDAARALILAPLLRPEVIVVDLEHGQADGVDLIRRLRAVAELEGVRFLGLGASETALSSLENVVSERDVFLSKPVVRSALLDAVRGLAPRTERET